MSHQLSYHAPQPAVPRRLPWSWPRVLMVLALSLAGLFALLDLVGGGERRSLLWPGIDTHYAPGYSEQAFSTIKPGMTRAQVDALMTRPLAITQVSPDTVRYHYTSDGKCPWGDFAWKGREVLFKNGVVVEIYRDWYHD